MEADGWTRVLKLPFVSARLAHLLDEENILASDISADASRYTDTGLALGAGDLDVGHGVRLAHQFGTCYRVNI